MKNTKRILSVFLALMLCLSMLPVGALAGAYSEEVYEAYEAYIYEFLLHEMEVNSTFTNDMLDEFMALVAARDYVSFPVEMLYDGMLVSGTAMTIDEFAVQYETGAYETGVTMEREIIVDGVTGTAFYRNTGVRSGVLFFEIRFNGNVIEGTIDSGVWTAHSGEREDQRIVDTVKAAFEGGGEEEEPAPGGSAGTYSEEVYEACEAYIYEFLLHEMEVNSTFTNDMLGEFMALVAARDYVSFPAEMLYNGMLASGTAMTIDEFAARYLPGDLDWNGSLGAGDAVALMKCILNDSSSPAGDLNDDGATDILDVIRLVRYLAGENVTLN